LPASGFQSFGVVSRTEYGFLPDRSGTFPIKLKKPKLHKTVNHT
jgi:hypothetical protein